MLFTLDPDGKINGVVEAVDPVGEPYPRVRYREFEEPIPTSESELRKGQQEASERGGS